MKASVYVKTVLCLSLLLMAACAIEVPEDSDTPRQAGQLALTSDILADTDVAGFSYTITAVDCPTGQPLVPEFTQTVVEDLADAVIPGGDGSLEGAPYDADSQHLFADHFFWLPEGCYDILVQPLDENGEPSEDCHPAHNSNVQVYDGLTTEVLLISQCEGEGAGGLDVIATLNHPPQILDLTYEPSKFVCAGEEVEICIEVSDPDNDPLTMAWRPQQRGGRLISQTESVSPEGNTIFCSTWIFTQPGQYTVGATVFDMGYDDENNLVTIESLLAAQGDRLESRDEILFPIHVLSEEACIDNCGCPDGFEATVDGDDCIRTSETEVTASETVWDICKAFTNPNYSRDGAQYPGGTVVENSFWGEHYNDLDSRLNTVGVWACDPEVHDDGERFPTTEPTGEWIGFSLCLDIPEAGDYILGFASDNQMRFKINGNLIVNYNTNITANFTWWWNQAVTLQSGLNIIEIEGYNQSQAASFGAEFAGPFPANSLVDDASMIAADYENNIIFSTIDLVGQPFQLGEESGYSCPDGFSLNLCGEAPTCTQIERVACE
jgi:hypothetical protein